jgi:FkbM family methyltransferase
MSLNNSLFSWAKPLVERFPRLAAIYRAMRDQLDLTAPAQSPWGFKLAGNAAMARGTFEPEETKLVRDILEDVDVLVNVGANVGYYCCHALSMNKSVIAFEPIQRNVRYLCRNIKLNGWSCEIYPIALSNGIGVLEIYGGDTGASLVKGWAGIPEGYVTLAPYSTMDLVLGSRLENKKVLIVVDVEGAEKWVLEGSSELLRSTPRPTWLIEIAVSEHQPSGVRINPRLADTFQHMFDAGYRAYTADSELQPVTMAQVQAAMNGDRSALRTHNFLFR